MKSYEGLVGQGRGSRRVEGGANHTLGETRARHEVLSDGRDDLGGGSRSTLLRRDGESWHRQPPQGRSGGSGGRGGSRVLRQETETKTTPEGPNTRLSLLTDPVVLSATFGCESRGRRRGGERTGLQRVRRVEK